MFGISYRPKQFKDVIGQDRVINGVQKYLLKDNFPQVSAFVGSSGCGKSTTARLVAMALNCENPIKTENSFEPCCNCPSCKDIIEERFGRSVSVYNGSDVSIDVMRQIEENLQYDSMTDKNTILIFEEAQLINSVAFKSFLTLVESSRQNTYFILTSTDKNKFSNSYGKDNKSQEQNAFRSRLGLFDIKGASTDLISDYLFKILGEIDPYEKLPNELVESIPFIAQNSKNNIRQAVNDFEQCINCEVYDKQGITELLNYIDDEKESEIVYLLSIKSKDAISYIKNSEDLEGNFRYWNSIISNNAIREMSGEPFNEEWKEKSYQKLKSSGNLMNLFDVFVQTHNNCSGYFDATIFIANIYKYYMSNSNSITPIVKKVKKVYANV